jgi:hypothetical protein
VTAVIGIGANIVFVSITAGLGFFIVGRLVGGHRVSAEVELAGLDVPEMGVDGYVGDPGIDLPDEAPPTGPSLYSPHAAGGR